MKPHPKWERFLAWAESAGVEPSPEWFARYLVDGGDSERKPKAIGHHACTWGCGAVFRSPHTAAEHNKIAHHQCPTCKRWYRNLERHYTVARTRPVARNRPGWNCWMRVPAKGVAS